MSSGVFRYLTYYGLRSMSVLPTSYTPYYYGIQFRHLVPTHTSLIYNTPIVITNIRVKQVLGL